MEGGVFVSKGHMAVGIWCAVVAVIAAAAVAVEAESSTGKKVIVAMEALVNCQDCASVGTWDLAKARPLPGARVVLTCRDHRGRVVLYRVGKADDNGYVFAELYATTMRGGYFDPVDACGARLLTSPDEQCSAATDVNGGVQGAPLRFQNTTVPGQYADIDVYVAGPLAFRPLDCLPKTSTQS